MFSAQFVLWQIIAANRRGESLQHINIAIILTNSRIATRICEENIKCFPNNKLGSNYDAMKAG